MQRFARHADPRTTMGYYRDRDNYDRHASYTLERRLGPTKQTEATDTER